MLEKMKSSKLVMSLGALFCCAVWGGSTPVVKMGYAYTDPTHVPSLLLWAGIQFLIAGVLTIVIYSAFSKRFVYPKKQSIGGVCLVSLLQTVLQYSLLYIGLLNTTAVKGAILKSTDVFFVALIASFLFRMEKMTIRKLAACLIGFAGIVVMNLDGLSLSFNLLGDGLVLLGIFFYSFSVVMTKRFTQEEDPFVLTGYQMLLGGLVMMLIGIAFNGKMDFAGMLPIILVLSVLYAVSYSLWTVLLKNHPASSVTIHSFTMPIFGVIISALLLNEEGGVALPNLVIALALVCAGIILWGLQGKKKVAEQIK